MSSRKPPAPVSDHEIHRLIRELANAEDALQAAVKGKLDAVIDPETGAPLLLRQAQSALSESSARYNRLIERMSALIFELRPDGSILYANPALARIGGYSEEELVDRNFWDLFEDPSSSESTRQLQSALKAGDVANRTCRLKTRHGDSLCVEVTTANRYGADGRLERIVAFGLDVTERERAIAALHWMDSIVRASDDAIIGTTADGRVTTWSPGARSVFGYEAHEAVGRPLSFLASPDRVEDVEAALERVQRGERVHTFEAECLRKDGAKVSVSVNLSPIHDDQGQLIGAACVYRDISEYRKLQEEFRQAQKMEAAGRLAGGVAHDFNNLLSVILGYCELLTGKFGGDDPDREFLQEIQYAGERASALTRQLLAFSRKQVLDPKVVDLNRLIQEFQKMLKRLIGEDIELKFELSPDLWKIKVDPFQIEQVLMNTALNSRDAMPEGGVITIALRNVVLDEDYVADHAYVIPGQYVELRIADSGLGMDEETRSHVFEPFFTTKGLGKGTGLGLSTVYGIVKQSGGYVEVDSAPGRGTTFRYYFPREPDLSEEGPAGSAADSNLRGKETILLVEDEDGLRRMASRILRDFGYVVLEAQDGPQGLALAGSHPGAINLLLTDVVMPGMNGRTLADHVQKLRPNLAVLFVSGYPEEAISRHGVLEKGRAFLQKPYTPEQLATRVRSALDQQAEKEKTARPSSTEESDDPSA